MSPFLPTRSDGRSAGQVVFDCVEAAEVETIVTYDELMRILWLEGQTRAERDKVYHAVRDANRLLLRERQRYLQVVKGKGYRVIRADEHVGVALLRKGRAEQQIQHGIRILRHVRMDELTATQRTLHEGQMMIMAGIYQHVQDSERRHAEQEKSIDLIRQRLDDLEKRK